MQEYTKEAYKRHHGGGLQKNAVKRPKIKEVYIKEAYK